MLDITQAPLKGRERLTFHTEIWTTPPGASRPCWQGVLASVQCHFYFPIRDAQKHRVKYNAGVSQGDAGLSQGISRHD